jgi:hypothetical protein
MTAGTKADRELTLAFGVRLNHSGSAMSKAKPIAPSGRTNPKIPSPFSWTIGQLREDWIFRRGETCQTGKQAADSWLVLLARSFYLVTTPLSPWHWFNFIAARLLCHVPGFRPAADDLRSRYWIWDFEAVVNTAIVIVLALWISHVAVADSVPRGIVLGLVIWRLIDIWRMLLRIVVIDHVGEGNPWTPISSASKLLHIPLYVCQSIFIFAIIYQLLVPSGFSRNGLPALSSLHSYVYVSATTITTLGSGYTAITRAAEVWQLVESATGIALLGIALTVLLGRLRLG